MAERQVARARHWREKWLALFVRRASSLRQISTSPRSLAGSTEDRRTTGSSAWLGRSSRDTARDLGNWHGAYGPVAVFRCVTPPEAVLAIFRTGTEGFEFIVDPSKITDVSACEM